MTVNLNRPSGVFTPIAYMNDGSGLRAHSRRTGLPGAPPGTGGREGVRSGAEEKVTENVTYRLFRIS
jgi:hypothetical protein